MAQTTTNLLPKTIEQIANKVFEIRDKPEPPKNIKVQKIKSRSLSK